MAEITELIQTEDFRYIVLSQDRFITPSLKFFGSYAPNEMTLLCDLIRDDDVVLDIGANIGTHTLYFARKAMRSTV